MVTTVLAGFAYSFLCIRTPASAAIAACVLGLAVLTRFMVLPIAICGFGILFARGKWRVAAVFLVAVLPLALAWPIRNHSVNGSWWPTRSGLNLYIGNSPYSDDLLPTYDLDLLEDSAYELVARERPDLSPSSPEYAAAADAFLHRRALEYMTESPARTLGQKFLNIIYFLSPRIAPYHLASSNTRVVIDGAGNAGVEESAERPRVEVWAFALASSFVLLTAALGVFIRRRSFVDDAILWSILATFVAVNAMYVPASRYAAPMLFVLMFYSSVALTTFSDQFSVSARSKGRN
jgi:hypothetical protein